MRRASLAGVVAPALLASAAIAWAQGAPIPQATCDRPLYLTFDTGHMGVAPLVAEVLAKAAGARRVRHETFTIDRAPDLPARYRIRGVPTIGIFRCGEIMRALPGVHDKSFLRDWLADALQN